MADRYLLESGAGSGYLLEDGSGVLLLETPPMAAVNRVSHENNADATSYATGSWTPTAGSYYIATVTSRGAVASTIPSEPTVSGNGITWTKIEEATRSNVESRMTMYRGVAGGSPSAGAFTADFGAEGQLGVTITIDELSGVDTGGTNGSAAVVQTVAGNGATGSAAIGSLPSAVTAGNGTYAVAHQNANAANWTPGTGWTEIATEVFHGAPAQAQASMFRPDGQQSIDYGTSTNQWLGIGIELQPPAAGGGFQDGAAALSSTGTLGAAGQVVKEGASALSSLATVSAAATVLKPSAAAPLAGAATVSAFGTILTAGSVAGSSVASVSAAPSLLLAGAAPLSSLGTLSAKPSLLLATAGLAVAATGTLSASAEVVRAPIEGAAALSSTGALAATPSLLAGAVAPLAASGAIGASGTLLLRGSSALAGSAVLAGLPSLLVGGAGALSSTGTLGAVGTLRLGGVGALVGIATLEATSGAGGFREGAAALLGTAAIFAGGGLNLSPTGASLAGAGSLGAAGSLLAYGTLGLAATGTIAGSPTLKVGPTAPLLGIATLTPRANLSYAAALALEATAFIIATPAEATTRMVTIRRRLLELLGPAVGDVDESGSEPFEYVPRRLYMWELSDRRPSVGPREAIVMFRMRAVVPIDSGSEEPELRRSRAVSEELDQLRDSLTAVVRAHQSDAAWDLLVADVDHSYVRGLGVRGVSLVLSGQKAIS